MNLSEELHRLESVDLAASQRFNQRLVAYLNSSRDPELLSDLVDFQLQRSSKAALGVLVTLKDIHSQVLTRHNSLVRSRLFILFHS